MDCERFDKIVLDLLYDDHQRTCRVHCELSVRMLLQREPSGAPDAWCGTDPSQRWQDKLDRLRTHQLPLGQHPSVPRHPTWPTIDEALILVALPVIGGEDFDYR